MWRRLSVASQPSATTCRAGLQRRLGDALRVQQRGRHHGFGGVEPPLSGLRVGSGHLARVLVQHVEPFRPQLRGDRPGFGPDHRAGRDSLSRQLQHHSADSLSTDSQQILLGSGDIYNQSGLTWAASLGKQVTDAQWKDNLLIDVDTTDRVEIRDATTRTVLAFYQYLGQPLRLVFGQSEAYLVHVLNNTTTFTRMPFYDADADSMPRWWETLYGLDDSSAADAAGDLDSDGVTNASEYTHRSNPLVADTDADGLTDSAGNRHLPDGPLEGGTALMAMD